MQHAVGHIVSVLKKTCKVSPLEGSSERFVITFDFDQQVLDSLKRAIPALASVKVHQNDN
jgi:hypothetical protein